MTYRPKMKKIRGREIRGKQMLAACNIYSNV